ncbi:MAG: hypothetical protein NTY02_12660 [Acidobacteria bacterium]|nr:hypothetical protein [Acidobacteriota bacterium]
MKRQHSAIRMWAAAAALVLVPVIATAGTDPQAPPPAAGKSPVVIEPIENGPVFAIDVKFTQVNDRDVELLGGYGGVLLDQTLMIGGAGYWMINGDYYGEEMGYGGALVQWFPLRSGPIAVNVSGLVGGGVSRMLMSSAYYPHPSDGHGRYGATSQGGNTPPASNQGYYLYDQDFFIFEPGVNLTWRMARGFALVGGVGYRVIAGANGFEDQLGGVSGSIAIRFGGK